MNSLDFWANEASQKGTPPGGKGFVITRKITAVESGKKSGKIAVTFEWQDAKGNGLLTENRTIVFYSDPKDRTMDWDIRLTALAPVSFNDTKEGTFAVRLATALEEKHSGKMHSAEGGDGEKQVWGKRSPWVDYAGVIDGEAVILDDDGLADFDALHSRQRDTEVRLIAFDLLAFDGYSATLGAAQN